MGLEDDSIMSILYTYIYMYIREIAWGDFADPWRTPAFYSEDWGWNSFNHYFYTKIWEKTLKPFAEFLEEANGSQYFCAKRVQKPKVRSRGQLREFLYRSSGHCSKYVLHTLKCGPVLSKSLQYNYILI